MDFMFIKSSSPTNEGYGTICGRLRIYQPNTPDKGQSDNKSKVKVLKASLGIELSETEWDAYRSGIYDTKAEMPSLGITFGKFHKFMDMVRKTIDTTHGQEDIRLAIQREMMRLITSN